MRPFLILASVLLTLAPAVCGAPAADPLLTKGLQVCLTNGVEAGVLIWYADRPKLAAETRDKIAAFTKDLGNVIDTEVVTVQPITKRLTRFYVAIYFARRPLWLRVDRYTGSDQSFFIPLRCKRPAGDLLFVSIATG